MGEDGWRGGGVGEGWGVVGRPCLVFVFRFASSRIPVHENSCNLCVHAFSACIECTQRKEFVQFVRMRAVRALSARSPSKGNAYVGACRLRAVRAVRACVHLCKHMATSSPSRARGTLRSTLYALRYALHNTPSDTSMPYAQGPPGAMVSWFWPRGPVSREPRCVPTCSCACAVPLCLCAC